ncbi:MAG: DNA polymerase III subunit beta [Muribaculaceae bacterium]|jgi:DNA polymerase-3 subunit beta|uniref:DNA polymerase III subunit beta n=1 Tax=Sangeribacter muris TaxID=2880703 RepID=UPI000E8488D5|nr:DNA polymerase III subunit beta [Sangeribacter muris]MBJ2192433.1 DNA polymerase III subunit beta [Muribaculaceae bacterium]ROT19302.1 DNA polymerase III subunit beta [Muribaculaceae bacterium Isolate-114 (HZI)]ROT20431.1 DNA polymerase III subunit beta [Muribaculaceae bacterium Isolate-113 (HZI)]RXE67844.1 DNA polymerase III subunit beta [Muribaculaceae bacterium Isolate-001 (NCI)]HBY15918.1 DNA polymerase III subunit beta [Porphyromonadaceae bacterium]
MKFNVEGKTFQQQLSAVSKVINAKNALSILDNFLLKVEGDRLSITGSDQENVMTAYMTITESEGDGAIAVSAKRLLEITKEISSQPLTFYINDETKEIDIRFLNGHFNFMGVDATEYPARRNQEAEQKTMMLPASMVQKGIDNTLFAVSADTVRPIMTGIYWDIHENDVTFVSSDTHKLVRYINSESAPGFTGSFILPSKPANILKSIIGKEDGDVKIVFDSKGATFELGDYLLSCLFINGNYPNYNRVIPQENPFEMTIDRVSLLTALRRVSIFAAKSSNLVVLDIQPNEVILHAQDLDYGTSAEERVNCSYEGNTMTIGFNGQFMIEILNNLHDDSVVFKLSDPGRPGIYTPLQQQEGEDVVIIQMPMQVL